jgi:PAS domain S-box-containing protein
VSEKEVFDVLAETADGAFALDRAGRILLWNRAAEQITGLRAEQVVGRGCCDVMRGRDSSGNTVCIPRCHIQTMVGRGEPPSAYDLLVTDVNGGHLCLNISTILVRDENGEVSAALHLFRDVTSRRDVESHRRGLHQEVAGLEGAPGALDRLTPRERQVLSLMAVGTRVHVIAAQLSISVATVRNHTQNILRKLGVHSKLAAVALAHQHGLTR